MHEERRSEVLVDRDLNGSFDSDELQKAVEVALLCTQSYPSLRPKMSEVVKILEAVAGSAEYIEEVPLCERTCSSPRNYSNSLDESSFIIEAMELSGPR